MSIDQAFIKAYRHDDAEPAARPSSNLAEPAIASALMAVGNDLGAHFSPSSDVAALGATVAYVSPAAAYAPDVVTSPPVLPGHPRRPAGPLKRPLSSFTRSASPNSASAAVGSPDEAIATASRLALHPGTTIASLRWPAECRQLLHQSAERFDRVAGEVLSEMHDARTVIGFIGLFRGAGATTMLMCTAARLASFGRRVVIVEGHFQSPRLSTFLDAEPIAWWQDVLRGSAPLADALVRAEVDRLDLLSLDPNDRSTPQAAEALQLSATAGALRHAYDVALVDLGTFFDPTSQPAALDLVRNMRIESVLAVSATDPADVRDLATISQYLSELNCKLLGTIENRVES
jgi:Mrp family chromosome partitioning ATPase